MLFPLIAAAQGLLVTEYTNICTTIYLHRSATHGAIVLRKPVEWWCRFSLWLTTGMKVKEWVAIHRKHHRYTDKLGDPHSPKIEGFWKVQWGNVFYYLRERKTINVEKWAPHIKEDIWDRLLFNRGPLGLLLGTALLCGWTFLWGGMGWGLLSAGLHAFLYVFVFSSSINGLCHHSGYKNFENTAFNRRFLALLTAGEGLHNNHHGFQNSPKFSWKSGEIDPAWPVIKVLTWLGLASIKPTIEDRIGT
jgi:stearoyl-CoA desaturase (delta-9 desaturase)